jgi:long-chain acyl-CoA synthetase
MTERTLVQLIERIYSRGEETAYVHRRGYRTLRWSYRKIAESACQFARELEARSLGKGDRVFLWGENCAEWVVAFLGSILRGAVVVPMDSIASPEFARRVYQQVDARLCVCSRALSEDTLGWPVLTLEDLPASVASHHTEPYPVPGISRNDSIQIVFTSGTTADPKGVVISHGNVLANLEPLEKEIAQYLKYERVFHPLRFLNLLPLSHVFGQFLGIFVPQVMGATVVFHDTLNPSEIMRTIKRERVSVLITVPRLLGALRDKVERDFEAAGRLPTFREQFKAADGEHFVKRWWRFRGIHGQFGWKFWAFISGGAALDAETEKFWGRLSFVVIQGYGLTETTSLVSVNHPFKLGKGSIGQVLPGRELRLAENGEILVRGENIASGYYRGNELIPVLGQEGWFHTGDIGTLDDAGNLFFKGRKKSVIVTPEGLNVYPEDLEAALRRQPEVRDCVVIGLMREGNAIPCAVLILNDGNLDPESVIHRANESLAEFQRIRRWYVWPEEDFPRTSTQKPRTSAIQELVQSRLAGQGEEKMPTGGLADLFRRITGRQIANLSPDANLATDLNLSSIERVELLSALEDRFQIDLNESRFTSATTVGDLEEMLRQPVPHRTDYRYPRWAQRWPVVLIRLVVYYLVSWPATMVMCRPRIRGRENLQDLRGPLLFVANHITQVDIGFIMAALPFRYRHHLAVAMLGEMLQAMRHPPQDMSFFKRCIEKLSYGLVVALFNVFPLPQQTGFRESFAFAGESVDRGFSIVVFPEGERTQSGRMSAFRAGVGMLATNLQLPIVPVRIDGLFELKQKRRKLARPGTVTVSIGRAVHFEPGTDPESIARDLERRMDSLSFS